MTRGRKLGYWILIIHRKAVPSEKTGKWSLCIKWIRRIDLSDLLSRIGHSSALRDMRAPDKGWTERLKVAEVIPRRLRSIEDVQLSHVCQEKVVGSNASGAIWGRNFSPNITMRHETGAHSCSWSEIKTPLSVQHTGSEWAWGCMF